jgi:hypothetical protein
MTDISVLFVGNSYTYCHNMPQMVARLGADAGDLSLRTETFVQGGVTLAWHSRRQELARKLEGAEWDLVVLQEQSRRPVENPDAMLEAAVRLNKTVHEAGAGVVMFMTWARRDEPDMQEPLETTYRDVAEKLDAGLAPVGVAWKLAREKASAPTLYEEDGSHPTAAGAYLTACTLYAALANRDPVGLPGRLETGGELLVDMPEAEARALQEAAREAMAAAGR